MPSQETEREQMTFSTERGRLMLSAMHSVVAHYELKANHHCILSHTHLECQEISLQDYEYIQEQVASKVPTSFEIHQNGSHTKLAADLQIIKQLQDF